ncbi:acetyl-CoA carboxylase carboxyl transferase subunit beta [Crossiella equi]|uniref:Acetyl-coenzyme A carboxylase carboxyl transferase subunits beta/alpha n=1 Tax=Crossiella equi TaxID=130796 RepID=A0ABS5A8P6_9PSEU|nr:carboxyl transferase domain-containing protein [Crossiella equi]MBP2472662.1 acetyl-CoA carboxylase carboxyl transferase subunit beta [Crossiella equi]
MTDGGARTAIAAVTSEFAEFSFADTGPEADYGDGPLGWAGYRDSRSRARTVSGETESVVCGQGQIGGQPVVLVAFDFRYIGGSLGQRAGNRICRAFEIARRLRWPVVSLISTGGSRMQEGMRSLLQLQRIARQCQLTRWEGLAHVAVLREPTTGGVWASLGAGADVVIGLRGASVAFGGHRVRDPGEGDGPEFHAEGKLAAGQVDAVVAEHELPAVLRTVLELLTPTGAGPAAPAPVPRALGRDDWPADGMAAVRRARAPERPRAEAYLEDYFDRRFEISGDRAGGVDPGMRCGFGRRGGETVAFAAQTGTANTPAGFRTAARLVRLADQLRLPILTLVDTPGAANGVAAEQAGMGSALAELFGAVASVDVPVTTLVIGEGGSGGALALASADRLWITPDAYFSVIAPELGAAILKRGAEDVARTANQLRLRPQDLLELGVVHGIAGAEPIG